MATPAEPVTVSAEKIAELSQKLATLRHNVNNDLSLIMAAVEIIRRRPESAERMLTTLVEQPRKISDAVQECSREIENALHITRP